MKFNQSKQKVNKMSKKDLTEVKVSDLLPKMALCCCGHNSGIATG